MTQVMVLIQLLKVIHTHHQLHMLVFSFHDTGDGAEKLLKVVHSHHQLHMLICFAHDTGDGADTAAQSHPCPSSNRQGRACESFFPYKCCVSHFEAVLCCLQEAQTVCDRETAAAPSGQIQ